MINHEIVRHAVVAGRRELERFDIDALANAIESALQGAELGGNIHGDLII